jgi:hypothetical protein
MSNVNNFDGEPHEICMKAVETSAGSFRPLCPSPGPTPSPSEAPTTSAPSTAPTLSPSASPTLFNPYRYIPGAFTYEEGKAKCQAEFGDIATIFDAHSNELVYISDGGGGNANQNFWIGLTDIAQEGTYVWEGGMPLNFTSWASGQPDDGDAAQNCISMSSTIGPVWLDNPCNITLDGVMCEGTNSPTASPSASPSVTALAPSSTSDGVLLNGVTKMFATILFSVLALV